MKIIILFLLVVYTYAIDVEKCPIVTYKDMTMHYCQPIKKYQKLYFHDITGENRITAMPNRLYHNHGKFTAMIKQNTLYVATQIYSNTQWIDALENI